jgi:hypothetical protein
MNFLDEDNPKVFYSFIIMYNIVISFPFPFPFFIVFVLTRSDEIETEEKFSLAAYPGHQRHRQGAQREDYIRREN